MINKDTQLCMSLSGRPGNFGTTFHNYLYQKLGLNFIYKAFTTTDIENIDKNVRNKANVYKIENGKIISREII